MWSIVEIRWAAQGALGGALLMDRANNQTDRNTTAVEVQADQDLIERCVHALEGLVPVTSWGCEYNAQMAEARVDAVLTIWIDGQQHEFAVEAKRRLAGPNVGPIIQRARVLANEGIQTLICADRIPPARGLELRQAGVGYIDLGGNAHLVGHGLHVLIDGRPPTAEKARGGLRGTEARLLGVFLRDQDAGDAIQQDLAGRAGIALGAVGRARKRLEELHVLTRMGNKRWRVTDHEKGVKLFADGWGALIRPKLNPVQYRATHGRDGPDTADLWRVLKPKDGRVHCLVGGEWAAAALTDDLVTKHATLHITPQERKNVVRELGLVRDPEGPITILDRYGKGDGFEFQWDDGRELAHPLVVWAECLTVVDERVASVAEKVRIIYQGLAR